MQFTPTFCPFLDPCSDCPPIYAWVFTVVSFIQKCYLTMTMCVCVCIMCIICMHAYSRHADIVQVLIIALFSVTDSTGFKFSVLRNYKQRNVLHVQNVSKVTQYASVFSFCWSWSRRIVMFLLFTYVFRVSLRLVMYDYVILHLYFKIPI
jgi:hypothetical protein